MIPTNSAQSGVLGYVYGARIAAGWLVGWLQVYIIHMFVLILHCVL